MAKELLTAQPDNCSLENTENKVQSINLALNKANARLRNDLTNLKQQVAARNQQLQLQCKFNDVIMDIAEAPIVVIDTDQRQNRVLVSVFDSGAGINAERASTIFELSASPKIHGLGVGLRISRSLVKAHGWIEPNVPDGIVHFWLLTAP